MQTYRSRISIVLILLLVGSILPVLLLEDPQTPADRSLIGYAVLFLTIGVVLFLLTSTQYVIDGQQLQVKVGPISFCRIPIQDIEKIERSYNPLSSPAASLKRLLISAKGKQVLISPANEKEFIALLRSRNPDIQVSVHDKEGFWRFWDWDL